MGKVKQENQRLRAHVHSPIVRLGSRFSIPSTSSSSLLLKITPPVTPPAQTEEVGEVKKPSFKRSNSEPKVESPRRKLSCFTDDTVTVYDKFYRDCALVCRSGGNSQKLTSSTELLSRLLSLTRGRSGSPLRLLNLSSPDDSADAGENELP